MIEKFSGKVLDVVWWWRLFLLHFSHIGPKKNLCGIFLNQNFGFTYFGGWLVKCLFAKSNFSYLVGWLVKYFFVKSNFSYLVGRLVNGGSETRRIYQILEFGPLALIAHPA